MTSSVFLVGLRFGGFLIFALAISITGYNAYRNPADWWRPFSFSIIPTLIVGACLSLKAFANMLDPRIVPQSAARDHAIVLAGFGCVLALVGSLMLRRRAGSSQGGPAGGTLPVRAHAYKKCPDCAQTMPAEVAVCKHCSHQFSTG